jgi:hypothetical protein
MINAVLTEIRATLDAKVTPAGLDVNADLSLRSGGTRYGLTDAHRVSLFNQASALSAATYPSAVYSLSGELYYNDASGNQIAITAGGAVNVSATGGITGAGYGTGGVEVNWDAGATSYHFYSAAATYAAVLTGTITVAANSHVTVSGTGKFKHGNEITQISALAGNGHASLWGTVTTNGAIVSSGGGTQPWYIALPLPVGASISRIDFFCDPAGSNDKTLALVSKDGTSETITEHESVVDATSTTGAKTLTVDPEIVVTAGSCYMAAFEPGGADEIFHVEVHWNRP